MAYGKIKADTLVYDNSGTDTDVTIASLGAKADLNSPTFTGTPAAPTAAANTNTTQIATTAYVQTELGDYAPLASPTFTGTINGAALTLSGNLTVNGTTTTIDSTTLTVEDKNIELGKVDTPTDTTADGGGITLKGATDKTFNWVDATDAWTSSEHIHLGDSKQLKFGSDTDCYLWHDGSNAYVRNTTGSFLLEAKSGENAFVAIPDGAVTLYHDGSARIATSAAGVTVTGTVTDDKGNVRTIPQLSKSSKHTIVLADAGKHSINSSGGWELDTSTAFTAGMAITLINNSGSDQTIEADGVTLYNTADAATGNRTLAGRGMATVICTASNTYYISGAGLS